MRRRVLTQEELQLWQTVTQHDIRFESRRIMETMLPNVRPVVSQPRMEMPFFREEVIAAPLMLGAYAGIDRNTADRFKKGETAIDGVVDLHGMSREKAHHAVSAFIHSHWQRGSRCLLAITGKGMKNANGDESRGVLREALPGWLAEPSLRPLVLACDVAKPKHGGSGAYYILLRRKR